MKRREFLVAGALGALVISNARAQARPPRIGILSGLPLDKSVAAPLLLNALAELGYRDGAGMVLEYLYSDQPDRFPALARELIARKCDVLFALVSEEAAGAFRDARTQTPVVFLALDYDPVEKGMVRSLRQPGGNMTGVYVPNDALTAKRLELAQEVLPRAKRFLVFADPHTKNQLAGLKKAAEARGVHLTVVEYSQSPYDLAAGFESGRQAGVEGLIALFSPEFAARRSTISSLLMTHRLPAAVSAFMASEPGILISYSSNQAKLFQRAAEIGVSILKGAKPADIPVEQPDAFEMVVNLKTAKALGVKIPQSVMVRATKVIE